MRKERAHRPATVLVAVVATMVITGGLAGTVGGATTSGDIEISAEGTVEPGNTVTLTGSIGTDPAVNASVRVNGDFVGTTDANGQIEVRIPNASGVFIEMESNGTFGSYEKLFESSGSDNSTDDVNETDGFNETDEFNGTDDFNETDGFNETGEFNESEQGSIAVEIEGELRVGNTVTVVATIDGEAVTNATVGVNGNRVGTTDANGELAITVPDAPELFVVVEGQTAFGSVSKRIDGGSSVGEGTFENDTDGEETFENDTDGEGEVPTDGSGDSTCGVPNDSAAGDDGSAGEPSEEEGPEGEIPDDVSDGGIPDNLSDGGIPDNLSDGGIPEDIPDDRIPDNFSDGEIPDNLSDGELPGEIPDGGIPENLSDGEIPDNVSEEAPEGELPDGEQQHGNGTCGPGSGPGSFGLNVSVISSSVSHVGGPAPDTMPTVDVFVAADLLQIQLAQPSTTGTSGSGLDLASLGVTKETQFRIDVTTEAFNPELMVGSGDDVSWSYTTGSNQTSITITTKPVSQQYIFPENGQTPTLENWPTGENDQATVRWEAASSFAISGANKGLQDPIRGGYIMTDAQAFSTPEYLRGGPDQQPELRIDIAGPHLTVDGETNQGFYEAKLPDALLDEWDVDNGSELSAAYKGSEKSFQTQQVSDGLLMRFDVSYSSGTVAISPDENATEDGNVTENENTTENETADGEAGPAGEPPSTIASFTETTTLDSVSPQSLSGKLRVESSVSGDVSATLVRDTATNYSLSITAPDSATNVTFFLQSQAVESSQDIQNVTMYLDGQRQDFYVDSDAGPGNSPWIAFEIDHFSTRNVTFSSQTQQQEEEGSGLSGVAATYDGDGDGRIGIPELGSAATDYATGSLSLTDLSKVATTYASS